MKEGPRFALRYFRTVFVDGHGRLGEGFRREVVRVSADNSHHGQYNSIIRPCNFSSLAQ